MGRQGALPAITLIPLGLQALWLVATAAALLATSG
jgi:hypothetical protein